MVGLSDGKYTFKAVVGGHLAGVDLGAEPVARVITDGNTNVVSPLFFVQRQQRW
jgi:hypothetical protein